MAASNLKSHYISLIIPAKWFAAGRESLLKDFREHMLSGGKIKRLVAFADAHELFPTAEIKGGVCYYLEDYEHNDRCQYTLVEGGKRQTAEVILNEFPIFIRNPQTAAIVRKVIQHVTSSKQSMVDTIISADTPFGIPTNPAVSKKTPFPTRSVKTKEFDTTLYLLGAKQERVVLFVRGKDVVKNVRDIAKPKVFIPAAGGSGNDAKVLGDPIVASAGSVCSQTFLYTKFDTKKECENFVLYLKTRFFRFLVSAMKITQHAQKSVYRFVPLQDFTSYSDIDWSRSVPEIEKQLYEKYKLSKAERAFIESMIKPMADIPKLGNPSM